MVNNLMNLYIINTNLQKDKRYEQEMLNEKKCSAYRSTKFEIENIQSNDLVLLYTNKKGIVARGIASGVVNTQEDNGEPEAEYFMPLDDFYILIKPIPSNKLRDILTTCDPNEMRPFNKTSVKFKEGISQAIWDKVCMYV